MHTTPNATPGKPNKPRADFPLFAASNGQWAKKVNQQKYYFGSWKDDPKGEAALKDWLARKDSIHAGLDKLRVKTAAASMTLGQVMADYLTDFRSKMVNKDRSPATFRDYVRELQAFVNAVGADAQVAALRPEHFAKYAGLLSNGGRPLLDGRVGEKLGRHARRRVIRYIQAMLNWGAGNGYYPAPTYGNAFIVPDTRPNAMRLDKARRGLKDHSERIVTGAEVDTLVGLANPNFRAITLLGVNCGLGPADIGRLRWRHIDMKTGKLDMPRHKTGAERHGYVWKRTREALERVAKLRHTRRALEAEGQEALVFWTRKALPMYREIEVKPGEVRIDNAISGTFSKLARKAKLEGVTHYRLRHTFKTLGKRGRDKDALNLMMGHMEGTTGETYDHEKISFSRIRRVSVKVLHRLWPSPKTSKASTPQPMMRIAG